MPNRPPSPARLLSASMPMPYGRQTANDMEMTSRTGFEPS
jgi:hypothetical protein